jgi:gliding motility associated protien GldN
MKVIINKFVMLAAGFVMCNTTFAQDPGVLDGVYTPTHHTERKIIPYPSLREADVMWSKRMWRILDLREKMNHPLYFPITPIGGRKSLTQVIMDRAKMGADDLEGLTAYADEEFKLKMEKSEIENILVKYDTLQVPDDEGNMVQKPIKIDFEPSSVKRYRFKEDWFFDKQRSVLDVRIIGMCPVQEVFDAEGNYKGEKPLFWIYFPEARHIFANEVVFNRYSDSEKRTLEDIFWKRSFSSYIYKTSNVYDRQLNEYKTNLDLLLESKNIKEVVFNMEQDFWEY